LALKHERPLCTVLAVDASIEALAVARANATRLGISIECVHASWCDAFEPQSLDMIVSNPPYVAESDPALREGDVRFEPRRALAAGIDGLDDIRHIAAAATRCLKPGGWLLLEHGYNQAEAVRAVLSSNGFHDINTSKDYQGIERISRGRQ
jgi:release factor glutamine methyltransferase